MHWLFLLLALGAFAVAITTTHVWLLVLSLFAALVLIVLWARGLYVSKFGGGGAANPRPLHPAELQRMREQLANRQATQSTTQPPHTDPNLPPAP